MDFENRTAQTAFGAAVWRVDPPVPARNSTMVERDHPYPAPHPSPEFALGSDRAAFATTWANEARKAEDHNRSARRQAFMKVRSQEAAPTHDVQRATDR